MFYGVAEPLTHFATAMGGIDMEDGVRTDWAPLGAAAGSEQAAIPLAMAATILHYGVHPWGSHAIVFTPPPQAPLLCSGRHAKRMPATCRA